MESQEQSRHVAGLKQNLNLRGNCLMSEVVFFDFEQYMFLFLKGKNNFYETL